MAEENSKTTASGEPKVLDLSHVDDATFYALKNAHGQAAPLVVGNFADLQRIGAHTLGDTSTTKTTSEAVAVPPGMDEEEAKAGANRVIEEEARVKEAAAGFEAQRSDPGADIPDAPATTRKSTKSDK
jgi:hypothetical protein